MSPDFFLAVTHHLALLILVGALSAESALLRLAPQGEIVERLARLDALYGISAVTMLLAGGARLAWGAKDWVFYSGNLLFWLKLLLFALVGVLSIVPTLRFLAWRKKWRSDRQLPSPSLWAQTRKRVFLEVHLLIGMAICAAAMARGIGY